MIKEIGLLKGFVKVEKYNPKWQEEFKKEKKNLKKVFGNVALSIEHIGSTSIVGLSAKPIIDIAIGVDSLKDISKVKEKILKFSYYSIKEDNADGEMAEAIIPLCCELTSHDERFILVTSRQGL